MKDFVNKVFNLINIEANKITKSDVGFSNLVYFVNDEYVIKILEQKGSKNKFYNEIGFYKNVSLSFIPEYVTSGVYSGISYLIIKKVPGKSLYEQWHTFNNSEREKVIKQIADMLKEFNQLENHSFLVKKYIKENQIESWVNTSKGHIELLNEKGYNTSALKEYMTDVIPVIFKDNCLGLVYNDAHFDNLLYDGTKLYLIDFDRILYTSIDYELLILSTMVRNPFKFASEKSEPFVKVEEYQNIIPILKEEYKALFEFPYLKERLFTYYFFYQLGNAYTFDLNYLIEEMLEELKINYDDFKGGYNE